MKKAVGFYLSAAVLVLSLVALVAYLVNCGTAFAWAVSGVNAWIVILFICAAAISGAVMFMGDKGLLTDALIVAAPVALIIGFTLLLGDRVGDIASIFTFQNNAQNMADLTSALVALVVSAVGALVAVVRAFTKTVKA